MLIHPSSTCKLLAQRAQLFSRVLEILSLNQAPVRSRAGAIFGFLSYHGPTLNGAILDLCIANAAAPISKSESGNDVAPSPSAVCTNLEDLAKIVAAWPSLPEPIKPAMLGLIG